MGRPGNDRRKVRTDDHDTLTSRAMQSRRLLDQGQFVGVQAEQLGVRRKSRHPRGAIFGTARVVCEHSSWVFAKQLPDGVDALSATNRSAHA